jgi:hypothetical protein
MRLCVRSVCVRMHVCMRACREAPDCSHLSLAGRGHAQQANIALLEEAHHLRHRLQEQRILAVRSALLLEHTEI